MDRGRGTHSVEVLIDGMTFIDHRGTGEGTRLVDQRDEGRVEASREGEGVGQPGGSCLHSVEHREERPSVGRPFLLEIAAVEDVEL